MKVIKNRIFTLFTIGLFFNAKADTLDYWKIYLNDSLLGTFNFHSTIPEIELSRLNYGEDSLDIRLFTDTPCSRCKYELFAKDQRNRKLFVYEMNENAEIKVSIKEILRIAAKNNSRICYLYIYGREAKGSAGPDSHVVSILLKD